MTQARPLHRAADGGHAALLCPGPPTAAWVSPPSSWMSPALWPSSAAPLGSTLASACCPSLVALHLRGVKHHGRITQYGVDDVLVARGLPPMDRRRPGLPGLRGGGLEILGAFATGKTPARRPAPRLPRHSTAFRGLQDYL